MCPTQEALHSQEVAPRAPWSSPSPQARAAPGLGGRPDPDSPVTMAIQESHDNSHGVPEETRRWEKGEEQSHPACPDPRLLLLSRHCFASTQQRCPGAGVRGILGIGGPACYLTFLHLAGSSGVSSRLPAPVGTSVAPSSPQNPPRLAATSQFPGKPLKHGPPGSKHLCFFWNQTPGTRFFLQQHFPQFTKCRASQVLCHQPAHSVRGPV